MILPPDTNLSDFSARFDDDLSDLAIRLDRAELNPLSRTDEGFLQILDHLRNWVVSDKVYYPLSQSNISAFFDLESAVTRLDGLAGGEFDEKVKDLKLAIGQAHH